MKISTHLQNIQPSYIREILQAAKSKDVISLAGGLPDSAHLPVDLIMQAMGDLQQTPEVFQYGETTGYKPLLDYLVDYCQLPEGVQPLITNGSQQGLDLVARAFLDPGDVIVMEAPSYLGALQVFGLAQADIQTVDQTPLGPDLNQLEHVFKNKQPKLFYAVPDFHNPTGLSWALSVREDVARLCQQYKVAFVEDSPYRELRFANQSLPMVSSLCPDNAIVLRSFSKVSAPGLRLGLVTAPSEWLASMIKVKQAADLHTAQPSQATLLHMLKNDLFDAHLQRVRTLYCDRYQTLSALLREALPNCQFNDVEGGMFLWLELPEQSQSMMQTAQQALDKKVAVVPGDVFYLEHKTPKPALRLNFSHCDASELEAGVERLRSVLA